MSGEMKFDPRAVPLFERCYKESEPTEFDDEATTAYKTSMWAQVTKLSMCLSASRSDNLVISEMDFRLAYDSVKSVLEAIPRVFRAVGESELAIAGDKILKFIESKGFATRQEMMKHCWRDVTLDDLDRILAAFKESGILYEYVQGKKTLYALVEKTKKGTP